MKKSALLWALLASGCALNKHVDPEQRLPSNTKLMCLEMIAVPDIGHTAFTNLSSFDYVNHAFKANPQIPTCANSWPLSRNNYGYHRFLFLVENSESKYAFLYQDASVQAHHNVGQKSWVALDPKATLQILSDQVQKARGKPAAKEISVDNPGAAPQAMKSFMEGLANGNAKTLSISEIPNFDQNENVYYLAVIFEKAAGNIFSKQPKTHTYFIERSGNTLRFYKGSVFDLESQLSALLKDTARHQKDSGMSFVDYLQKISQVGAP